MASVQHPVNIRVVELTEAVLQFGRGLQTLRDGLDAANIAHDVVSAWWNKGAMTRPDLFKVVRDAIKAERATLRKREDELRADINKMVGTIADLKANGAQLDLIREAVVAAGFDGTHVTEAVATALMELKQRREDDDEDDDIDNDDIDLSEFEVDTDVDDNDTDDRPPVAPGPKSGFQEWLDRRAIARAESHGMVRNVCPIPGHGDYIGWAAPSAADRDPYIVWSYDGVWHFLPPTEVVDRGRRSVRFASESRALRAAFEWLGPEW